MSKEVFAMRLDPKKVAKLTKTGATLTAFVEAAVDKALKDERCPACGKPLKRKSRKL